MKLFLTFMIAIFTLTSKQIWIIFLIFCYIEKAILYQKYCKNKLYQLKIQYWKKKTQLEKVHFIKVNELKLTQVELCQIFNFMCVAANASELFCMAISTFHIKYHTLYTCKLATLSWRKSTQVWEGSFFSRKSVKLTQDELFSIFKFENFLRV